MSNALAIATVTRALSALIEKAAGSGVTVSTSRPEVNQQGKNIHLFMYQVLPDTTQRNNDLPSRSYDGTLRARPTVALTLQYLVTFQGDEATLDSHKMLGAVARDLNAHPVLSRELILSVSNGSVAGTNLGEALDPVRITALPLGLDEISKIWLMFSQVPYALSVAYEARVVLIEAEETPAAIMPVLARGEDDRGPEAQAGTFPALDDYEITVAGAPLQGPRLPSLPSAQLGLRIALTGRNLGGEVVTVRFTHPLLGDLDIVIPPADRTPEQVRVTIPNDAAAQTKWAAGIYLISVRIKNGTLVRSSDVMALPFAPSFTAIAPPSPIAGGAGTDLVLTLTCSPQIAKDQRVTLIVADREMILDPPAASTGTLVFTVQDAPAVTNEMVLLRVDGVNSVVFKQDGAPPKLVLDDSKRITFS